MERGIRWRRREPWRGAACLPSGWPPAASWPPCWPRPGPPATSWSPGDPVVAVVHCLPRFRRCECPPCFLCACVIACACGPREGEHQASLRYARRAVAAAAAMARGKKGGKVKIMRRARLVTAPQQDFCGRINSMGSVASALTSWCAGNPPRSCDAAMCGHPGHLYGSCDSAPAGARLPHPVTLHTFSPNRQGPLPATRLSQSPMTPSSQQSIKQSFCS